MHSAKYDKDVRHDLTHSRKTFLKAVEYLVDLAKKNGTKNLAKGKGCLIEKPYIRKSCDRKTDDRQFVSHVNNFCHEL